MTETGQTEIVRRKFSLTAYHNDLLNDIVEQRYASRSEALRAAIQHHVQILSEHEDTDIESLKTEIEQIADQIEIIHEKLDERGTGVVRVTEQEVDKSERQSDTDSDIRETIVTELLEQGSLSVDELTECTDEDVISVITASGSLEEEGIIRTVGKETEKYELNR
jgi:Arc/MetJ-type ribon-helix-helix transcriptional regulator